MVSDFCVGVFPVHNIIIIIPVIVCAVRWCLCAVRPFGFTWAGAHFMLNHWVGPSGALVLQSRSPDRCVF